MTIERDLQRIADAVERIADALAPVAPRPAPADVVEPELAQAADILRYAEHLNIVINTFEHWREGELPSVRAIRRAVDRDRRADRRGQFSSQDIASKVQHALAVLRDRTDLLTLIRADQVVAP